MSKPGGQPPSPYESRPTEPLPPASGGARSEQVGPYRLLRKLGEGGMGEVWEAEQARPVRRRVAIKLIRWGMDTREVVARFESERQALAMMEHPNIARVFDAGATAEGRPYFAMELVRGISLVEYCDREKLDTRHRLELFREICEGVQHAHVKGIIHRDLKPSNILVTAVGERPQPKIIDFGVAKATQMRLTEQTVFTQLGQWIGTPEYMSPEQAEMSELDVDTRTDVYSLGVILYELLVGSLPFESKALREAGFDEMRRRIREEVPPRPSTRFSTLGIKGTRIAEARATEPETLTRRLKGDLDWIVMKALEKDRTRRYGSARELSEDVGRHLRDEPILAGPPSLVYRGAKFVRRHRVGVAAALVVLAAMTTAIVGTSIGMVRARRAEARATQDAESAHEMARLMVDLFRYADPSRARGASITAREVLDLGARRIRDELAEQPLLRARLLHAIGEVYLGLALYDEARPLLEDALALRRELLTEENPDLGETLARLADVEHELGDYAAARRHYEEALALQERNGSPDLAETSSLLGLVLDDLGERQAALTALERAVDLAEATGDDERLAKVLQQRAQVTDRAGEGEESRRLYQRALQLQEGSLGPDHPEVAQTLSNFGASRLLHGDYPLARSLLERSLEITEAIYGADHLETAIVLDNYAAVLTKSGELEAASPLLERSLEIQIETLGASHPRVAGTHVNLGELHQESGRLEAARSHYRWAYDIYRQSPGEADVFVGIAANNLGEVAALEGRDGDARRRFEESLRIFESRLGADHALVSYPLHGLARLAARSDRPDEAEAYFRRSLDIREVSLGDDRELLAETQRDYAAFLRRTGRAGEAASVESRAAGEP